jgi:diguanylate cyclase (GGDEF)-like protein/PAS domain S-box-containing protein
MNGPKDPRFHERLLDSLLEGVYVVDRERRISYWNHGAQELVGYSAAEVVGRACYDGLLVHTDENGHPLCESPDCPANGVLTDGQDREEIVYVRHREGYRLPVLTRLRALRDEGGAVAGVVELFSDATQILEQRARLRALESAALMDPVTGVGNRRYGEMVLHDRIGSFERYGLGFAVVFGDVDLFKAVNDRHGHAAGDAVLRTIAETLRRSTRSSDAVARWGGEEFLVVLTGCTSRDVLLQAERLRRLVAHSSTLVGSERVTATISLGAATIPPVASLETIVARADALMYEAKRTGRNRVCI